MSILEGRRPDVGEWPAARRRLDQLGIRCVFMRGGTSRGAILHAADLPADPALRERVILAIYGSPDVRQIDGLGGADPLTSKVAIVAPSARPDADVDFTFGQVRIDDAVVDFSGNCGNISAAIGPFAVDEGLVAAVEPITTVRIHLVNTGGVITADVAVGDGITRAEGDTEVPGVPGTGAPVLLDFGEGSSVLGRGVLPTGVARETVDGPDGPIEISIVDAGNPTAFVAAASVGMTGSEPPDAFDDRLLARLLAIRAAAAVRLGLVDEPGRAEEVTPAIPKLYVVAPAAGYVSLSGRRIEGDQIDLLGRGLSMGVPHKAYAGTVAISTGVARLIPGTVVADLLGPTAASGPQRIRIGHPSGVMGVEVAVDVEDGTPIVRRAAIERTARRIMDGTVYVPAERVLEDRQPARQ